MRLLVAGGPDGRPPAALDVQRRFFEPKPFEELYDCDADPHEIKNLAAEPAMAGTLDRLRKALDAWILEINDLGFLPEPDLRTREHPEKLPLAKLMAAAAERDPAKLAEYAKDAESANARYGQKPVTLSGTLLIEGGVKNKKGDAYVKGSFYLVPAGGGGDKKIALNLQDDFPLPVASYPDGGAITVTGRLSKFTSGKPLTVDNARLEREPAG